jgi:hypothetical protein
MSPGADGALDTTVGIVSSADVLLPPRERIMCSRGDALPLRRGIRF